MLAIGMSLMAKPKLMLLDEPLLGLAPAIQVKLIEAIVKIKNDAGVTIMICEQFARPVLPIIDRGYVLENGMLTSTARAQNSTIIRKSRQRTLECNRHECL